jgi:glycosyltransferase involved in cell wall biosynthesis
MNILQLNDGGALAGGAESYIVEVAAALKARGHEAHLVYFAENKSGDVIPGSTHVPLGATAVGLAAAKQALERVIEVTRSEVAYVHAVYSPELVDWLAQRLPTVAYVHNPYPTCPGSARFLRRSERACPHRPGLVCLGNAQRERCCWGRNPWRHWQSLRQVLRYRLAYARVGHTLVGSTWMQRLLGQMGFSGPMSVLAPVLLSEQDFAPKTDPVPNLILFAGRLVQEKGLEYLFRALTRVRGAWQLEVAGDGPLRSQYQALAHQMNIADRVSFCGWLNPAEMRVALGKAAFVVVPSLWPEPFGRMGAEAFVHGRPLVAYAVGGVPDWLEHQVTGMLVAPGDITGLAQSIQQLLDDPARCEQMGERGRSYARQCWLGVQHADRLIQHFESCRTGALAGH